MSKSFHSSTPRHIKKEFMARSDLKDLIKSGQATQIMGRSFYDTSRSHSLKHSHNDCLDKEDQFAKTAAKLSDVNFHHHNDNCLCSDCSCGRHICKLKIVKPELTVNSIYQRSYYPKDLIANEVNHDKEYDKLKGDHLDINSIYRDSFKGKDGDKVERPHPEDLLHSKGPAPLLSSYTSQFPGYKGDNQYVKPTDKYARGHFPMRTKSTYANEFINKSPKKDDYVYYKDQLKTGYNWMGKTTYGSFYNNPNPEYHAKKVKINEKKEDNPDFKHQYGNFLFIQKLYIRTISLRRTILFALLRCTLRPKQKDFMKVASINLWRIVITKPFPLSSMPYQPPNILMFDLDCKTFIMLTLLNKKEITRQCPHYLKTKVQVLSRNLFPFFLTF